MVDPILPLETLETRGPWIAELVARLAAASGLDAQVRDPDLGSALGYYLAFTHWHEVRESPFRISAPALLYNRYFWHRTYAARSAALHGPDAGLEQEAFKMLADSDEPIDLDVIDDIDRRVANENR